jgi:hypothetical protein
MQHLPNALKEQKRLCTKKNNTLLTTYTMKTKLLVCARNYILLFVTVQSVTAQNVGIGTTNTSRAKLEVQGAAGATSAIFGGEGAGISFQRDWPGIGFNEYFNNGHKYMSNGFAAVQFLDPNSGYMSLHMFPTGAANATVASLNVAMVIGNNGNVGIKTSPGNASLYAIKGGNYDGAAVFAGTNYNSQFYFSQSEQTYIRPGKAGSNVYINDAATGKIIIGAGGNFVGINSSLSNYPLHVVQTGGTGIILVEPAEMFNNWEMRVAPYQGGPASSLNMIYNGGLSSLFRPSDGSIIVPSDRRIKTNIRSLPPVLDKLLQLRPVSYEMKYENPEHEKSIGFIAQEVRELFPEMVQVFSKKIPGGTTITDFNSLNYNPFKILAVKGVQEEQQLIEDLQSQQASITRRLEMIEKKLAVKN